jgi:hypothetical protein
LKDGNGQSEDMQMWKQLYVTAVLELDPERVLQKIGDAQKAISERALALMRINQDESSEKQELANAHTVLDGLKRIHRTDSRGAA